MRNYRLAFQDISSNVTGCTTDHNRIRRLAWTASVTSGLLGHAQPFEQCFTVTEFDLSKIEEMMVECSVVDPNEIWQRLQRHTTPVRGLVMVLLKSSRNTHSIVELWSIISICLQAIYKFHSGKVLTLLNVPQWICLEAVQHTWTVPRRRQRNEDMTPNNWLHE